ncbi:class I SAM-dependent rRNA methyltransferase [Caproiciproducens galactitolivorans]|uniref:Ribosomal RNA large subunit methyltransferase I n=1 Tax=Caproiciproducens galactitolivorans TaxID=642589 RepID=A0A4Z0Y9I7_9FIRM|nr:class I SAM-dependent rRNA methyltransferase [Caproiciproducens galactitolivorans]QEY33652.1 class I SAM-dependent rRNA methyltransferase [Caproiciproducens galactitolivorans]TGJ76225.1 ribosomal RNA large subunit methyltransferase I [Caproiciproducens galactitolivorans]
MKQKRNYPKAILTRKAENSILAGHPWVYNTEILKIEGAYQNGELIDVFNTREKYLGTGFINDHSKIRIRLLSRNANDVFDEAFFERRLRYAWNYRKTVMGNDLSCCRIIFGEADQFPGLTVDRFNNILVTQTLSLGMEKLKPILFPLLCKILAEDGQTIDGVYERNDVTIRELEGMEQNKGFYPILGLPQPESTQTTILENGIEYSVDFENGQKTGFFLDQKYNRKAVAQLSRGKKVLDCFTHTGSFALNAAKGGAERVHAVDISEDAITMAQENAKRNGLQEIITFQTANVFDLIPELPCGAKDGYDFIILDPPAFTKSRHTVVHAIKGYKEINLRAMKVLPRGGYLATCSCSHFMTDELFRSMLRSAAFDAHVSLKQIEARQQAPDHPILWNVPETSYLKFYIFQIV